MRESRPTTVPDARAELALLLQRASELEAELLSAGLGTKEQSSDEHSRLRVAARRLKRSVIRPLHDALAGMPGEINGRDVRAPRNEPQHGEVAGGRRQDALTSLTGEPLWQLAQDATTLGLSSSLPGGVQEAIAAVQGPGLAGCV